MSCATHGAVDSAIDGTIHGNDPSMQLFDPALMFPDIIIRDLGRTDYQSTLAAMQNFTANRTAETPDELWLTEHDSVYT